MIRSFLLLFILTLSLHALSDFELLKRARGFVKSSSKSEQFRAYNDFKNLYLRTLVSDNEKMQKNALQGIVKSGKKLHIDVSQYSEELSKFKPKSFYIAPKKISKIKIKSSHRLKSIRWKDERLVLSFDKKLRNNQINYFTLYDAKHKRYKYVFDIHASMLTHSQTLIKKNIDKIKVAQYKPNTLRIVIENRQKVAIRFKKSKTQLIVNIIAPKKTIQKKRVKKFIKKKKYQVLKREVFKTNKIIVIDAGHGGKDPGAIGYKHYREKVVVLQIAQELKRLLKKRGYKVYMTRDSDKFIKLRRRTKYANQKHANLFISIHANAVGKKIAKQVYGLECYFLDKSRSNRAKKVAAQENSADMSEMNFYAKESFLSTLNSHNIVAANKLAIDLQRGGLFSLRKHYKNVKDAGVRPAPFWVLVGAQMPAVLVEVGFITNPTEAKRLVSGKYQKILALGLANGVQRYFLNN